MRDAIAGEYDVIVLPDTYEHIPVLMRKALHDRIAEAMAMRSICIITCPSPGYERQLHEQGGGLQIVDGTVTLEDLVMFARDIGGELAYFNLIDVWRTGEHSHAVIERGEASVRPLNRPGSTPLKLVFDSRWRRRLQRVTGWRSLAGIVRRWRLARMLRARTKQPPVAGEGTGGDIGP